MSDSLWPYRLYVACQVHGISQARILEQVAISFSRGSSWPRDWTCVSCTAGRILYPWAAWEREEQKTLMRLSCDLWVQRAGIQRAIYLFCCCWNIYVACTLFVQLGYRQLFNVVITSSNTLFSTGRLTWHSHRMAQDQRSYHSVNRSLCVSLCLWQVKGNRVSNKPEASLGKILSNFKAHGRTKQERETLKFYIISNKLWSPKVFFFEQSIKMKTIPISLCQTDWIIFLCYLEKNDSKITIVWRGHQRTHT